MATRVAHTHESCVHQKKWTTGLHRSRLGCDYTLATKEGDNVYNVNKTLYNDSRGIDKVDSRIEHEYTEEVEQTAL